MKNFIRGTVLGLTAGVALFWYGGLPDYFPAIVAAMILVGILLPLEKQEKELAQISKSIQEILNKLHSLETNQTVAVVVAPKQEGRSAFIPTIQADTATSNPSFQKKRTVERSLEDVAKKLSSMQGGEAVATAKKK